jgi:hypothetical protein
VANKILQAQGYVSICTEDLDTLKRFQKTSEPLQYASRRNTLVAFLTDEIDNATEAIERDQLLLKQLKRTHIIPFFKPVEKIGEWDFSFSNTFEEQVRPDYSPLFIADHNLGVLSPDQEAEA